MMGCQSLTVQSADLSTASCAGLMSTRSYAVAERPHDASCHCRACVSPYISIPLKLCISYRFWDIQRQKFSDIETGGRGRSRSLKIASFDRPLYDFLLVRHCKYSSVLYSIASHGNYQKMQKQI